MGSEVLKIFSFFSSGDWCYFLLKDNVEIIVSYFAINFAVASKAKEYGWIRFFCVEGVVWYHIVV